VNDFRDYQETKLLHLGEIFDCLLVRVAASLMTPKVSACRKLNGSAVVLLPHGIHCMPAVFGETMPSRTLAIGLVLVLSGLPRGAEHTLDGETRGVDAKDWPTYNCDVLGWRHNAGETDLSRANVGRLEEKWRFPPNGADFEIGGHALLVRPARRG